MSLTLTPKDLLDAGVHFGHQTKRWNPRSKPFIFDHRQGVSIIDLGKTHEALTKACAFLEDTVANGGNVLFVGTKRQAKEIVREAATSVNMPMCVDRWLGGTLTNYETVKKSVAKFKKYQAMETNGEMAKLPRKEESAIKREMTRMQKNFNGISDMGGRPRCSSSTSTTIRSPSPRAPAPGFPASASWTPIPIRPPSRTPSRATTTP